MEVKEIEFAKLRHAYITVKAFLETESYETAENVKYKIGSAGNDPESPEV